MCNEEQGRPSHTYKLTCEEDSLEQGISLEILETASKIVLAE